MNKQLFTINEAAKLLGVSIKTLRRWDQKGLLSAQRTIGNQRRYDLEDLEKLKGKKIKSVLRKQQIVTTARQVAIAEAAAFLGISVKTLRRWEAKGIVTSHRSPTNQRFFLTNELSQVKEVKTEVKTPEVILPQSPIYQPTPKVFNPTHAFAESNIRFAATFFSFLGIILTVAAFGGSITLTQVGLPVTKLLSLLPHNQTQESKVDANNEVLASQTKKRDYAMRVSVPAEFLSTASVSGNLTAPNILYSVVAGNNITITGDAQNPTISAVVEDLETLGLTAGEGIAIDGTTITNTAPGTDQDIFANIKVGSTTLTAGSNTDTFELVAGDNISLSADTSNKKITITADSPESTSLTVQEGDTTVNTATTLDFLGGDFDVGESPTGEANISLASTLTSVTGVAGSFAVGSSASTGTTLNVGTALTVGTTLTLGSDTINDITGTGLAVSGSTLNVNLTTLGGAGVTSSNSGLEVGTNGLTLLKGCAEGELLKWDDTNTVWACGTDVGGGGSVGGTGASNRVAFWTNANTLSSSADFYWDSTNELLGIGTNGAPIAALDIRGSTINGGTTSIASFSGQSSFAGLVVDNSGSGDIFTASSSGINRFVIKQNGNVGINTTLPTSTLDITGTLAVSGTTTFGGLTYTWPGTQGSGQILQTNGSGVLSWVDPGTLPVSDDWDSINGVLTPKIETQDLLLGSQATASARFAFLNVNSGTPTASLSAGLAGGSYLTADGSLQTTAFQNLTLGGGDTGNISLTPKSGGTLSITAGTLSINGQTGATSASLNCVSVEDGIVTAVGGCGAGAGGSKWTVADATGVLYPQNPTVDLLIGGTSTASAKFAVINIAGSLSPIASLSAGTAGAAFLTASGQLQTTNNQSLTLGGGNTGDINLTIGGSNALRINGTAGTTYGTASCVTTTNGIVTGTGSCPNAAANDIWQTGNGSIFQGNTTQDLLIGAVATESAKFAILNVAGGTPVASLSAGTNGAAFLTASGNLQTTAKQSLTLGGGNTGNIVLSGFGTGIIHSTSGVLSSSAVNLANSDVTGILPVANGGTGVNGSSASNGQLLIGNGSGFTLATLTEGAGIAITNAGGSITIAQNPFGASKWSQNTTDGTLYPNLSTLDFLIGGVSTASARFAVINAAAGTPVASVSAGTAGGAYLSANGTLATTAKQSLTLGDSNTGNVVLNGFATGIIHSTGGVLSSSAVNLANSDVTGVLPIANGGTNKNLTLSNGGIVWSDTDSFEILSANANSGLALISGGAGTPSWFTPTQGSIIFAGANGALSQDNASFFFDDTNNRLGIGTTTPTSALDVRGINSSNGGTTPIASIAGITSFAGLLVDNAGAGDIFAASASGMNRFVITQSGGIVTNGITGQTVGTASCVTTTNGIVTGSGNCPNAAATFIWQTGSGAIFEGNTTQDLLLGSAATSSAKFAFTNVAGGTPTASISAISGNNALSLDASGNIATTNEQTLTLGSTATGDINFIIGAGNNLRINGTAGTTITSNAQCVTTTNGIVTGMGACPNAAASDLWNSANGTIFPGNITQDLLIGGIASSSARFHAYGSLNAGTTPAASIAANSTFAGLVVDNSRGDLFTASSSGQTRFVVTQNGNVGIGTTLPSYDLEIASNINTSIYTKFNPITNEDWRIGADANGFSFINDTDTATRMVIDENGNVGIGATDPTVGTFAKGLEIESAGAGPAIALDATAGKKFIIGSADSPAGLYFRDDTAGVYRMVIDTNGSIGIGTGTNSVLGTLDVRGNSGTTPVGSISGQTSFASLVVDNKGAGDLFTASSSGLTRFVISQKGNVGIGVTAPAAVLHISQNHDFETGLRIDSTADGFTSHAFQIRSPEDTTDVLYSGENRMFQVNAGSTFWNNPAMFIQAKAGSLTSLNIGSLKSDIFKGTASVASIAARTSFATLVVDNSGAGDLFTASSSGLNRFVIKQNGTVGINNATGSGRLVITGITDDATQQDPFQVTDRSQTGYFFAHYKSTGTTVPYALIGAWSNSLNAHQNLVLGAGTTKVGILNNAPTTALDVTGVINASSDVTVNGTSVCLENNTNCPAGLTAYWTSINNALSPSGAANSTSDLLIGGVSSASARFHVYGSAQGGIQPVASISGNTSYAGLVTDNKVGDLFTASSSGLTRFVIGQNGSVTMKASTSALLTVENAQGADLMTVDSLNNKIDLLASTTGLLGANSWSSTSTLVTAHDGSTVVTANGYLYNVGGASAGAYTAATDVEYARINTDGSLGTWKTTTSIPNSGRSEHASVVANGYVYVLGGTNNGAPVTTVYYAKLNPDGTIGGWRATTAMPTALMEQSAVVIGNYVYVIGGFAGGTTWSSSVYYAKLNADGTVGAWSTATQSLPAVRSNTTAVTANGYIYVLGGKDGTALPGGVLNTVFYARPNPDGNITNTWVGTTSLPAARQLGSSVVSNGYIYYMGGKTNTDATNSDIIYAPLNSDGTVGNWTTTTQLSQPRQNHASAIVNGYIYIVGGGDLTNFSSNTTYYISTARVRIGGNLDLIGLQGQTMASGSGDLSLGTTGGSLTAGNGMFVGGLQVLGQTTLSSNLSVGGAFSVAEGAYILNSSTTAPVASISGTTSGTGLIVDNSGTGAIFNALSNTVSRFYINNAGNVGVGTTSPESHLSVTDTLNGVLSGTSNVSLMVRNTGSTNSEGTAIGFANSNVTTNLGAKIVFVRTGSNSFGDLSFFTKPNTTAGDNTTEKLRITGEGRVGITTPAPLATFDVRAASISAGTIAVASFSGQTSFATLVVDNSDNGDLFTASSSGKNRFVITQNGNVGIGLTAPTARLTVSGGDTAGDLFTYQDYDNEAVVNIIKVIDENDFVDFSLIGTGDSGATGATGYFRGKVGIGTTSPLGSLDIRGITATIPTASVSANSTFAALVVDNRGAGDIFTASSSGLNRFVIKNNGNVGIGTTSPQGTLHVVDKTPRILIFDTDNIISATNPAWSVRSQDGRFKIQSTTDYSTYTDRIDIDPSTGNVGIGDSDPTEAKLVVGASGGGDIYATFASANSTALCWDNAGASLITDCSAGPTADYAEMYATASDVEYGDLVTIGTKDIHVKGKSIDENGNVLENTSDDIEKELVKSTIAYDPHVIGIVTNNHGDFSSVGHDRVDPADHPMPVALNGRVPVKIASNSATIEAGDYITTSFVPGQGMKATKAGQVIGKALEAWSPDSGKNQILVFVTDFWRDPDIYLTSTGNISIFEKEDAPALDPASTYGVSMPDGSEVIRTGVFSDAVVGNLKSGSVDVQTLTLGGTNLNDRLLGLEGGFASASAGFATPLQTQIASLSGQISSFDSRVASLEAQLQLLTANSQPLIGFTASTGAELSLDKLEVNGSILAGSLNVLGYTTMNELSVTGSIRTGVLTITGQSNGGASINTLNGDLRLQEQGFGGVDILNGKVTIDTAGNVQTTGEITAKKLNIDETNTLSASVGQGTIPLNGTNAIIYTTAVTADSHIFITPRTKTNLQISVTTQTAGASFKVEITSPATQPIKFDWWIVN